MPSQPSPSPADDYVIVQPHRFQTLPLRTKPTLQPAAHHDSYPSSEDEYECVSSPDSIRSWNSTPRARSPSPTANAFEQPQGNEPKSGSSFDQPDFTTRKSSNFISKRQKQLEPPKRVLENHTSSASHAAQCYSCSPMPPTVEAPYVYTTPSEEGYPGTGVLRPTADVTYSLYAGPGPYSSYVAKAHSMQDPEQYGHRQIDIMILDRLIDHACEVRLKTDMRTPASRDAILRYEMMKRLRELPPNHPVIRKATIDSPLQCRPYQLRWTSAERLKAYRDVLTDGEKLACWYLFLTHGKHFHTRCLFLDFAESVRDLHPTANLMEDARKVAQSVQSPSLTDANVDAVLHDNELTYSTQLKVVANAEETGKIYDEVTDVADNMGSKPSSGDYHIRIPGTFHLPPPSPPQQYNQMDSDVESTMYLRRGAIKHILYQSLTDPMLPMPIKRKPLAVPPPTTLPSGIKMNHHALQDYQMQLMLLEQQNKKRYWCSGGLVPDISASDKTRDADTVATASTSTPTHNGYTFADYQAQFKLVQEQCDQNKRLYAYRHEVEAPASSTLLNNENTPAPASTSQLTDYETQLKLLEQQCKKRHTMAAETGKECEERRNKLSRTGAAPLRLDTRDDVLLGKK